MELNHYSLVPEYVDVIDGYNYLVNAFGNEWVNKGIHTYRNNSKAPNKKYLSSSTNVRLTNKIHIWSHLALEAVQQNQFSGLSVVTQDLYRASYIGNAIKVLTDSHSQGLQDKLEEIKRNKEGVEQYIFEICVAAMYAKFGYQANFITEQSLKGIRTPDIDIEAGELQLECKMIGHQAYTQQEIEYFQLLVKHIKGHLVSTGEHKLIKVAFTDGLSSQEIRQDIAEIKSLIRSKNEGVAQLSSGSEVEIWEQEKAHPLDFSALYHHLDSENYCFEAELEAEAHLKILQIPSVSPRIIAYKIKREDDPVKFTLNAIKDKINRKQLAEDIPGLIYVHLNKLDGMWPKDGYTLIKGELEKIIARSKLIDGIILISEYGSPPGVGFNYFAQIPRLVILKPSLPPWVQSMAEQPLFSKFL